jgi:hypothetical protein
MGIVFSPKKKLGCLPFFPSWNFILICWSNFSTKNDRKSNLYTRWDLTFGMSRDTLWVPFSFYNWWLVYPQAKLYSSRPSNWYVTQYPSGNFFILHLMTLEHSRAKLYSSRPFIWYVTWFHLGNFLILRPPQGCILLLETFHLIYHTIPFE